MNENGLAHRLRKAGLKVEQQYPLQIVDEDGTILGDFIADLYVENCLVVELKACKTIITTAHFARMTKCRCSVNFASFAHFVPFCGRNFFSNACLKKLPYIYE